MANEYVSILLDDDTVLSDKITTERHLGGHLAVKHSTTVQSCSICKYSGNDRYHAMKTYHFKCTKNHRDGRDCRTEFKLFYCEEYDTSELFIKDDGQDCRNDTFFDEAPAQIHGIGLDMKDLIRRYNQPGIGAIGLLNIMRNNDVPEHSLPTINQIKAFLQRENRSSGGDQVQKLTDAIKNTNLNSLIYTEAYINDLDPNSCFNFGYNTVFNLPVLGNGSTENPFLLIIASKNSFAKYLAVKMQLGADEIVMVHIDGTHKTTRFGYQLVALAASDFKHQLHIIGIS